MTDAIALKKGRLGNTALRNSEIDLKRADAARSRWINPLVIAIPAAKFAAIGNAAVSWINNSQEATLQHEQADAAAKLAESSGANNLASERNKAEAARILEVVKTADPDKAADNLTFLLDSGLIADEDLVSKLRDYLAKRKAGQGVVLPILAHGWSVASSCEAG